MQEIQLEQERFAKINSKEQVKIALQEWLTKSQNSKYNFYSQNYEELGELEDASTYFIEPLFLKAKEFEMFDEIEQYVTAQLKWTKSITGSKDYEICDKWYDYETPYMSYGVEILAFHDAKYIPLYIDYLKTCDMDHEVRQSKAISKIFEIHGLNESTFPLLIARTTDSVGQHGTEDFDTLCRKYGVLKWLTTDAGRWDKFIHAFIAPYLNFSTSINRYDCEYAVSHLDEVLDILGLNEAECEKCSQQLQKTWR